jgi:hypothetical protein
MRVRLFAAAAVMVALPALAPEAIACGPYVAGRVECSSGAPAEGIAVRIYNAGNGFCLPQTILDDTDALGEFDTCVFCTGTVTITVNGEARTRSVNGFTDFGTWVVPCGADNDQDALEDSFERTLAEKFSPVLHRHSFDNQPDLADIDQVLYDSRLIIYSWVGDLIWNQPLSSHSLHVTDTRDFCTYADDSLYGRMYVDFADSWRTRGSAVGSRPLYYHVYPSGGYIYIQYWYFLTFNDLRDYTNNDTWHEGDWEHVSLRVARVGSDYVPDLLNFYKHDGGHTKTAAQAWWSGSNARSYAGLRQGYDSSHTHLHVWLAADSHASYSRYDPVYHFVLSNLFGIGNEELTDNADYDPAGFDLYFPYDRMQNMGEVAYVPYDHEHDGRTFDYHRTHRPVDGVELRWLRYVGRIGDNWIGGFGCPWGTEKPQTPSPYTPATGEISHEWIEFTVNTGTSGFGNTGGDGCFLFSDGGAINWVADPPAGDGTCPDADGDGSTTCAGDCNDSNPAIYPGHAEVCGNTWDDDCDGTVNEGCSSGGGSPIFRKQVTSAGSQP